MIVEVIVALLLIVVVLLQQAKAGGGLGAIGGEMTESVFGANAGNVLTRTTIWLAAAFLTLTIVLAAMSGRSGRSLVEKAELSPKDATEEAVAVEGEQETAEAVEATVDAEAETETVTTEDESGKTE